MLPLGTPAPYLNLPDTVSGKTVDYRSIKGSAGKVVMFICNHCPFVIHVLDEILNIARMYTTQGFGFVAISSNDVDNYPQDAPDKMKELALARSFPFTGRLFPGVESSSRPR
jgi:hypothetical protein